MMGKENGQVSDFWTGFIFEFTASLTLFSLSLFSNKFAGEIPWSLQMVCLRCFILFSILFQYNTPLTLTFLSLLPIAIGRRSANGLFESFILFSFVILMQCAFDSHQFPSSFVFRCHPQGGRRRRRRQPVGADPDRRLGGKQRPAA